MTRLSQLQRSVAGRAVIVTGAASGMGRATAHLFADEGAFVAVVDIGAERVATVVEEIVAVHGADRVIGCPVDVTDTSAVQAMVRDVHERFGRLDIVVNNAGVSMGSGLGLDEDEFSLAWERTLAVNLSAYVHLIRAALPFIRLSDAARIINIASTESIVATPSLSAYSASKAGVTGLTRSLAVELGREGITVNCICPGPINTGMTEVIPDDVKATYARRRVPLRRYGEPEEVAHMTLNIALPAMSYLTGATIVVDGGMTIRHT